MGEQCQRASVSVSALARSQLVVYVRRSARGWNMAYVISALVSSPEGRILGYYKEILSARATERGLREVGQDGSVVTAMLYEALRSGFIDAAVVATRTEDWNVEPFVATTPEEVLLGKGPKYTACQSVLGVWDAIGSGYENIAMVGTGCNIEAVRRLHALHDSSLELDRVKLLIGLFGTKAFWHRDLVMFLSEREGIDIRDVERFYVSKGNFMGVTKDKEFSIPTKDMEHCYGIHARYVKILHHNSQMFQQALPVRRMDGRH